MITKELKSLWLVSEQQRCIEETHLWMGRYKELLGKLLELITLGEPGLSQSFVDFGVSVLREENQRLRELLPSTSSESVGAFSEITRGFEAKIEVLIQENNQLSSLLQAKCSDDEFWMNKSKELEKFLDRSQSQDICNVSNLIAEREALLYHNRSMKQEIEYLQSHLRNVSALSETRVKEYMLEKDTLLRSNEEILFENANLKNASLKMELHVQVKNKELDLWIDKYNRLTQEVEELKHQFENVYGPKFDQSQLQELNNLLVGVETKNRNLQDENER